MCLRPSLGLPPSGHPTLAMKAPSTAPQGRPSRCIIPQLVSPLPELAPSVSLPVSGTAPSLTPGTSLWPPHRGDDVASTVEEEIEQGSEDTEETESTDEEDVLESAPGVTLPLTSTADPASTADTMHPPTQCPPEQREAEEAARPPTPGQALPATLDPALHEHRVASIDSRGPTAAPLPRNSSLLGPASQGPPYLTIVHPPAIDDTTRPSGPGEMVRVRQGMSTGIRQSKGKEPVSNGPKRGLGIPDAGSSSFAV
ncbi:hypothetical protein K2173_019712 [Erythroxylum novogranatense]|uniref:Uncharacterized protein n=1 Tax=Erythroxylum novogranatense TaxID=1862640 RepID=A0AAV8SMA2_9ROSI|nr:hypothetical protein K2173_019712 [Erythroxylum novogranatense]